jgi:Icc-related predicted phosphoesterase
VIRIAAVADLHAGPDSAGTIAPHLAGVDEHADVFLVAGDLTRRGLPEEARILAAELRPVPIPIVAVLGNHDYHSRAQGEIRTILEDAGVRVVEGEAVVVDAGGGSLGVAGVKGFGGGFPGASATEFGEDEMKAFVGHTREVSTRLERALSSLDGVDGRVALVHYSPVEDTLAGERLEIYPFLGSYLLAEAVDRAGADLVLHGHAHRGSEKGVTAGGIHVRNVAQTVIGHAYNVYRLNGEAPLSGSSTGSSGSTARAPRSRSSGRTAAS